MPEKKYTMLIAIGISLVIAFVISIYSYYSGKNLSSPEIFGLKVEDKTAESKNNITTKNDIETVFQNLIDSYNNKDEKLLAEVDFRYANNQNTLDGYNYIKAINSCNSFTLLSVLIKNVTVQSVNGYVIYTYKINGDTSNNIHYVLSEYTVKSKNGKLGITYLNTITSKYEDIEKYIGEKE